MSIKSFKCRETEKVFNRQRSKRFANIERVSQRKLEVLDAAASVEDLKVPYSNHLEALKKDRKGQWSIRINDQFRICFRWSAGAEDVEIVDYH